MPTCKSGSRHGVLTKLACSCRSRYSVVPNMLIVAPQLLLYLATAPEEKARAPATDAMPTPRPRPSTCR